MNEITKIEQFDEKKISEILSFLKKSPTFNMSRGGRELFHTNFLAFILDEKYEGVDCQSYEAQVKSLILQQLFGVENTPKNVITFRERSNLDLIIIPALNDPHNLKKVVVIEAKLKSIPTVDQLTKYNNILGYETDINGKKKAPSVHIDLFEGLDFNHNFLEEEISKKNLAVTPTASASKIKFNSSTITVAYSLKVGPDENLEKREFTEGISLDRFLLAPRCLSLCGDELEGWKLLDWSDFLNNIKPTETASKTLTGQLVDDYLSSTKMVLTLVNKVDKKRKKFTDGADNFTDFYKFSVIAKDFRHSRLHDLVGKVAYSGLQIKLVEDLKELLEGCKGTLDLKGFIYEAYTFFSNSVPGLGIHFKCISKKNLKRSVCIGVQFQGKDYRHYIESQGCNDPKYNLKSLAIEIKDWICPFETKTEKLKVFGETKFVYQSVRFQLDQQIKSSNKPLDKNTKTYSLLLEKFKSSLEGALNVINSEKLINDKDFLSNFKGEGF